MRKETLVFGEVAHQDTESATDHGVLSHKDDTLTSQRGTNFVHLLGRDLCSKRIVVSHHEPKLFKIPKLQFLLLDRKPTLSTATMKMLW